MAGECHLLQRKCQTKCVITTLPILLYLSFSASPNNFTFCANPVESSGYSLEYYNDYKLLTNKVTNETYCLYCSGVRPDGTAVPSSTIKAYIQIPVQRIALHDLPSIDFLEILGSLDLVVAVSSQSNVTSPCAAAGIGSGAIAAFNESFYDSVSVTFTSEPVAVLDKPIATVSLPDSLTPLAVSSRSRLLALYIPFPPRINCFARNL